MEHNAVARTAQHLKANGVEVDVARADGRGLIDPIDIARLIKPSTRMVALIHASNVTGGIMPVKEVGLICRERGVRYLVDASQTAGLIPINVNELNADFVAFPGHKGLYGPPGIGVLYVRSGTELTPIKFGGTGSMSESLEMPEFTPDRYEAGTLNTVGIAGLGAGIRFVMETGMERIAAHERDLTRQLLHGLSRINGIKLYGPFEPEDRVGVVSFNLEGISSSEAGLMLDQVYGIAVRVGLHCAPLAHQTLGTLADGSIRVSFSYFNTPEEVDQLLWALREMSDK